MIFRAAVLRRLTSDTGHILLAMVCLAASLQGAKVTGWLDEEPQPKPVRYVASPVLVYGTASGPSVDLGLEESLRHIDDKKRQAQRLRRQAERTENGSTALA